LLNLRNQQRGFPLRSEHSKKLLFGLLNYLGYRVA
jgi:hypothetical protein